MERLLHYVWKYKLYNTSSLVTTEGVPIQVLDPGISNTDAGPDFFNAKIKINNTVWAGCVEIHDKASDWFRHHHENDKGYDSVILHVAGCDDATIYRTNGELIPLLILSIPEAVERNINWLLKQEASLPCSSYIKEMESIHLSGWLSALLQERLERKTNDIITLLEQYNNDWNEAFYITLTRNFGFGVNSDAFEWLAKCLPFHCIQKHRNNHTQIEAMLFGQAGMLEYPGNCAYYRSLQREYKFLSHKFGLKPLDCTLFKNLRVRPGNFPYERLAQLSAIWASYDTLFSMILAANTPGEIKNYLRISPSEYWMTHHHFRNTSPPKEKKIGEESLNILLINTVVPMMFAYGLRKKQNEYCDRAMKLLESLTPERNSIVHNFGKAGIQVRHAGDTQALIQLKRAYCEQKKCLYCRIGFKFLKRGTPDITSLE